MSEEKIEKIERVIFIPCKGLLIKHEVVFGQQNKKDQRRLDELSSRKYKTGKYSNVKTLISLKLESNDYLVLDYIGNKDNRENIYISYPHIFKVKKFFRESLKWFYDDEYDELFVMNNENELIFNSDYRNEEIIINNLIGSKSLSIMPAIVADGEEGVILFFNSRNKSVIMNIDQLESVIDFLENFRLYEASQLLINYVTEIKGSSLDLSVETNSSSKKEIPKINRRKKK